VPTKPLRGRYRPPPLFSHAPSLRQTGGCDPEGPREPDSDTPCGRPVEGGRSGYCECVGRARGLAAPYPPEADPPKGEREVLKAEATWSRGGGCSAQPPAVL